MSGRKPGSLCRFKCCMCGTVELVRGGSLYFRCATCRKKGLFPISRRGCSALGKTLAQQRVGAEIRGGRLVHPRALQCADCAGPAVEYEHRDYNEPLMVEPICRSCNLRRGPARPIAGGVERMLAHGYVPYCTRAATAKLCVLMGKPALAASLPDRKPTLDDWKRLWPELTTPDHPAPLPAEATDVT